MTKYYIPINTTCEPGASQTIDVLELTGTKKQKRAGWRRYLSVRAGIFDYHECSRVAKEMGFMELIKK